MRIKFYVFHLHDEDEDDDDDMLSDDDEDLSSDDEDDYDSEYDRCEANLQDAGFLPPEDEFDSSMEIGFCCQ